MLTLNVDRSRWTAKDVNVLSRRLNESSIQWSYRWDFDGDLIDGIKITFNRDEDLAKIIYRSYVHDHINPRKEIDMTASKSTLISDAEAQVARAIADLERAQANLAKAKTPSYPKEPREEVIGFTIQFDEWGKAYAYAARRTGGRWFTTGSTCPSAGYTWKALIDWMREAASVTEFVPVVSYGDMIEVN